MENLNTQVDLYLTEISIELLGNKIYNLNGERKHRLAGNSKIIITRNLNYNSSKFTDLFKALPEAKTESQDQSNDLLCSMEYEENFTEDEKSMEDYLDDQMAYTLVDANSNPEVNESIISFLKKYKTNQDKLVKDMSEMHVKKLVGKKIVIKETILLLNNSFPERNRILSNMNKARQTASSQSIEIPGSRSKILIIVLIILVLKYIFYS
jgi:hypothetical protein